MNNLVNNQEQPNLKNNSSTDLVIEETLETNLSANCLDVVKNCLNIKNKLNTIEPIEAKLFQANKPKYQTEDSVLRYFEKKIRENKYLDFETDKIEIDKHLYQGANINYKNQFKDNALILISQLKPEKDCIELFKYFLKNEAEIKSNYYGQTVLHYAALYDNVALIKFLLDKDISLLEEKTCEELQTPLHYAAKKGNEKAVTCLINHFNANKEAKDYQDRTPLYIAAEYGQKNIVRLLLELNCTEKVTNTYGQKALFWIIAKCPDLASEIMDKYRESNKYTRRDTYALKFVDLMPYIDKDGEKKVPKAKSILAYIVETENLELIVHPVISRMVNFKWKDIAILRSYIDLTFTFLNIVVWNILGVLIAYNERHIYKFPQDWWRIFLFVIGIIGMVFLIIIEIKEVYEHSKYFEKVRLNRLQELAKDIAKCHPKDYSQLNFLRKEELMCKKSKIFTTYITDFWNWFDIISIILLFTCVITHIVDIANHTEAIARAHIRIMSITVIFIPLRLLKVGRVINEEFGSLVMTLYFVGKDIFVWIIAYITFWIPFTSSFYMLFGNREICSDNLDQSGNCTSSMTIIDGMESYNKAMFILYSTTFGADIARDDFNKVDNVMSDILLGFFIGITTLLMVNIFIALLTSTFTRVHDSSKAYFILQRAIEIVKIENRLSESKRYDHLIKLKENYIDKKYSASTEISNSSTVTEKIEPVLDTMKEIKHEIDDMNDKLKILKNETPDMIENNDEKHVALSKSSNNQDKFIKIEQDFKELKSMLNILIEQENESI